MRRRFTPLVVAAVAIAAIQAACSGSGGEPFGPPNAPEASLTGDARRIEIRDQCDPATVNAALGAGTCIRQGSVTFDRFIDRLTRTKTINDWKFAPNAIEIRLGQSFGAVNRGGEVHTFTEVEEFGGGVVPLLNQLSGNEHVAPECQALQPTDFLAPGGTFHDTPDEVGTEKYQCCIHPWMRATVTIHRA
jgi:plastocyanin